MKKMFQNLLFIIVYLFSAQLFSFPYGITGFSGHPLDTGYGADPSATCSNCHFDNTASNAYGGCATTTLGSFDYIGTISASTSVSRGTTNPITYNLNHSTGTFIGRGGMGARIDSGVFTDTGGATVSVTSDVNATHNADSNLPNGSGDISWTWNWTAPSTPDSVVDLYVCGNPTNGESDPLAASNFCDKDGPHTNTCVSKTFSVTNTIPTGVRDGTMMLPFGTTDQDSTIPLNVINNDIDQDVEKAGDILLVSNIDLATFSTNGNVTNNGGGTVTYDPNGQYNYLASGESAIDRFKYTVKDDQNATGTAVVVFVKITGVNAGPVITVTSPLININEDSSISSSTLSIAASDADTSEIATLVWSLDTGMSVDTPDVLTVSGTGVSPSISYTPSANFNGTDSFTIKVTDAQSATDTITISVTVNAINDDPVISSTTPSFTINEGDSLAASALTISATDVESIASGLTWRIKSGLNGSKGTASVSNTGSTPSITYIPVAEANGSDTFTVEVTDENGGTDSVIISASITAVADNPIIENSSSDAYGTSTTINVTEDTPLAFSLYVSDADGDGFTWSSSDPSIGSISTVNGSSSPQSITYTPAANYNGADDSFIVTVTDNSSDTLIDTLTINVSVSAVSDPPVIDQVSPSISTTEDISTSNVALSASDNDGDAITWSIEIAGQASHGIASISGTGDNQTAYYVPAENFNGTDFFTVTATSNVETDTVLVSVTVSSINDAPVITQTLPSATTNEDTAVSLTLNAIDVESDALTWSILNGFNGAKGTAVVTSGTGNSNFITYTPNADEVGADNFTVQVSDNDKIDTVVVNVSLAAVNDAPVITEGSTSAVTMDEDSSPIAFSLTLSATDAEGDAITWSIGSIASNGTASVSALNTGSSQVISYTPNSDYNGSDVFTVQVSDSVDTGTNLVAVTINAINDTPILSSIANQTIEESDNLVLSASVTDIDSTDGNDGSGSIVWDISSIPVTDIVISNIGEITWTPPQTGDFNDVYNVTISAADGLEDSISAATTSFTITVSPVDSDSDGVANYDDFCPTTDDSTNADNDGDGTAGSDIDDTDNIGGDACDTDDDNDGMPDSFEETYNFDPFDSADASADYDGDGVSNLDEFTNGTEPKEGSLVDVTINATGYLTEHNWIEPVPGDINSTATNISANNYGPYRPGINEIIWTLSNATDSALLTTNQNLNVNPIVSLNADQEGAEGGSATVTASINGDAIAYPVVINYSISGTADTNDHDATSGILNITSGNISASFNIAISNDFITESNETIIVSLESVSNAVIGTSSRHTITINEGNVAPSLGLTISQAASSVSKIYSANGTVTVSANVSDANNSQSHVVDWSNTDNALSPPTTNINSWTFSPVAGTYKIALSVSDSGSPQLSTSLSKIIVVTDDAVPVLGGADTDGDGVIDSSEGYNDSDGDGVADYLDAFNDSHLIADQTTSSSTSLALQAEPGLKMIIGNTAIASGVVGSALTDNEISSHGGDSGDSVANATDGHDHIGGIYDFAVSGMVSGSSVYIVIPLQISIPKNAVYRKYSAATGWTDFVSDGVKNQVYSAKGAAKGVCPEVESGEYVVGLKYLDNCIQLLIEDGGLNDQDGEVNGHILDPGAISITVNDFEEETVEKGGVFNFWLLLLLLSLYILIRLKNAKLIKE